MSPQPALPGSGKTHRENDASGLMQIKRRGCLLCTNARLRFRRLRLLRTGPVASSRWAGAAGQPARFADCPEGTWISDRPRRRTRRHRCRRRVSRFGSEPLRHRRHDRGKRRRRSLLVAGPLRPSRWEARKLLKRARLQGHARSADVLSNAYVYADARPVDHRWRVIVWRPVIR